MQALLLDSDIALFTESHACSDAMASLLHVQGFTAAHHCVRAGRERGRGGVAVYVRAALAAHVVIVGQHQDHGFESVWLRVSRACLALEGRDLLIGAVYASPGNSPEHRRGGNAGAQSPACHVFGGLLAPAIAKF
jgi:exonuclease III